MDLVGVTEHPPTDDADEVLVTFRKPNGVLQNVTIKNPEIRAKFDDVKARRTAADDTRTVAERAVRDARDAADAAETKARKEHVAEHLKLEKEYQGYSVEAGVVALEQLKASQAKPDAPDAAEAVSE